MKRKLFGALILCSLTAQAQLVSIDENFDSFISGSLLAPQNGWSASVATSPLSPAPLMLVTELLDKSVQSLSGSNSSDPSYLISPEIVPPTTNGRLSFNASKGTASLGNGTVEAGFLTDPADVSTFVSLGAPVALTSTIPTNITVDVPPSSASHIALKLTPDSALTILEVDDISYAQVSVLAVSEEKGISDEIKFVADAENSKIVFFTGNVKNVKIYSAAGQNVAEGKPVNNKFDIRNLHPGVYYVTIENDRGFVVKSKFIKK